MKLFITTKANAKQVCVDRIDDTHFRVSVKAPPSEGRANEAVIETLAKHFGKPKSRIILLKGHTTKNKVVEIQ